MTSFYLSYTGRKTYLTCPKKYWFRYVMRMPDISDPKNTLFGSAIGKLFEWFYNQKLWSRSDTNNRLVFLTDSAVRDCLRSSNLDVNDYRDLIVKTKEEIEHLIPKIVQVIKDHRLLTSCSRSEVDLTVDCTNIKVKLGGRADFIHGTGSAVWILDGKGSLHREKFVDSEQLIWYALQHYMKFHVVPARIGFLYYKFPDDPIQWISFDEKSLRNSVNMTLEVVRKIKTDSFASAPSGECHRCGYRPKCDDGMKYLAARKLATGGRIQDSIFDLESV